MQKNKALFDRAKNYYIGGVDAANRFHTVLGAPLYLERVQGSRLYDVDTWNFTPPPGRPCSAMATPG